jgi:aminoglycoside 6-adenylyltransferase
MIAWASAQATVRALILTSSRVRPGGPVDALSDYDLILAVTDPERFGREDAWISAYGRPLACWGDESTLYDHTTRFWGVFYEDYVKIDYTIWPDTLLERVTDSLPTELDEGYRVLLDKQGRTAGWRQPTHRAYIPVRPTEAQYRALVEEFWWSMTYAAKSLWRGECIFAKFILDHELKLDLLRRIFEWRIEIDHDWSLRPGVFGRGLEKHLSTEVLTTLSSLYVGLEPQDNWKVLDGTIALFRRVAIEVGEALGYVYPQTLEDKMRVYLDNLRAAKPGCCNQEPS